MGRDVSTLYHSTALLPPFASCSPQRRIGSRAEIYLVVPID